MNICIFSDTHGKHEMLNKLPDADIAICCGDITNRGSEVEASYFMKWYVAQQHIGTKIFIPGNHDFCLEKGYLGNIPAELIYLVNETTVIGELRILAMSYVPVFRGWAFEKSNEYIDRFLTQYLKTPIDILITHTPPKGILDFTIRGNEHAGSRALLKFVKNNPPKIHCFGHIHEGYGIENTEATTIINASILDNKYYLSNQPIIIKI